MTLTCVSSATVVKIQVPCLALAGCVDIVLSGSVSWSSKQNHTLTVDNHFYRYFRSGDFRFSS